MNVVIQVDPATFQKMQATYPSQGNLPTGASFQAKLKGSHRDRLYQKS